MHKLLCHKAMASGCIKKLMKMTNKTGSIARWTETLWYIMFAHRQHLTQSVSDDIYHDDSQVTRRTSVSLS